MTTDDPAALAARHLLGALLHLDAATAQAACRWVQPDDLADPQLRAILDAIGGLANEGSDPQPALIVPRMVRDGKLPAQLAGVANALVVDLLTEVPHPPSWPHYAAIVTEHATRRHLRESATRLTQASETSSLSVCVELLAEAFNAAVARVGRVTAEVVADVG